MVLNYLIYLKFFNEVLASKCFPYGLSPERRNYCLIQQQLPCRGVDEDALRADMYDFLASLLRKGQPTN